ncbi:MAG: electron transfer flavoprotein subunit alpha/FixB family protein, partial [Acidobacteriota bacterium]|nr:electron transfer flavoprotein subunit alpha/FixB family protein [Acidobacteriota bacterium]
MILLVVEYADGKVSKSTWEMVSAGREVAQGVGGEAPVTALVLGSNVGGIAAEIARGVDQVLVADMPALGQYDPELWSAAVAQIA